jgi:putative DNA primase/helicase
VSGREDVTAEQVSPTRGSHFLDWFADGEFEQALAWNEGQHQFLDKVAMKKTRWLWDGYIPRGFVTLLTGEEGLGKSQLSQKVAAEFSRGTFGDLHPDASGQEGGVVKIYTAEDTLRETLVPRLVANEANLSNIASEGVDANFALTTDGLKDMARGISEVGFGMIIIDPMIAYFGGKQDSNRAQDVRAIMKLLSALAEETGCVIVGITHPKKGEEARALHQMIGGSSAFGQAARSVLAVGRHPTEENYRLVGRIKGNLSNTPLVTQYEIVATTLSGADVETGEDIYTSRVVTHGHWDGSQADFVKAVLGKNPESSDDVALRGPKTIAAAKWLRAQLASGPMLSNEINKRRRGQDFSFGTLDGAASKIGVERFVDGDTGLTVWRLPGQLVELD